jgi:hypothetical protein
VPYPSLYRAKAVSIQSGAVEAFVPQVFGETTITITDALGTLPSAPTLGWVFFQAGNPEFPVWSSGLGTGSAGGGGGGGEDWSDEIADLDTRLDVIEAGGTNEVWVGNAEPTDPAVELWFDPDEVIPAARQAVEPKGTITAYTLQLTDENKVLWFSSGSAITLTIPTYANVPIPDGWRCDIMQSAAGRITVGGAGITFVATPTLVLRAAGSTASLLKLPVLNTWLLTGDMG